MQKCSLCPNDYNFYPGFEGKRYSEKGIFIILHHSDERVKDTKNYKNILSKTWTGKTLNSVLKSCELDFEDTFITNFVKCIFPKDMEPKKEEYENCKSLLEKQIEELSPKAILLFGKKPYETLFQKESIKTPFKKAVGTELEYKDIPLLINLHPKKIYSFISLEKRRKHYETIQDFLVKYNACKSTIKFPKQMKLRL